jgi:exodeoxyribonuclease VII large subunit
MASVYSVSQVNSYIKNMFAQDFALSRITVRGEVSNCKYHSSGHIYFTLKDAGGTLAAVMFAGQRRMGLRFQMQEGQQVVVSGAVDVYERDGKYQLYAKKIELDGLGGLFEQFLRLRDELDEMGMFDPGYKQPIPKYAARVGVVTAPTGAAIQHYEYFSQAQSICAAGTVSGVGSGSRCSGQHCGGNPDLGCNGFGCIDCGTRRRFY